MIVELVPKGERGRKKTLKKYKKDSGREKDQRTANAKKNA